MKIYLAGGAVRDLLLGHPIADRDYLVTGTTREAFMKAHPTAQEVGKAFPVFLLDGMEFSFPRAPSVEEELKARDLTVNALLLDENGDLHCHPCALEDLFTKTLRPASHTSFFTDPARVYRAARFFAQFPDFSPHTDLKALMRKIRQQGLLSQLAPDRIGRETLKALSAPTPGNFIRLLAESQCLAPWFPELVPTAGNSTEKSHHFGATPEDLARTMDGLAGDPLAVWMGLCHGCGEAGKAQALARRIRLSNKFLKAGALAARWHAFGATYDTLAPAVRVDLLMALQTSTTLRRFFALIDTTHGTNHTQLALREQECILAVKLPHASMNLGPESGKQLRDLRARAIEHQQKK